MAAIDLIFVCQKNPRLQVDGSLKHGLPSLKQTAKLTTENQWLEDDSCPLGVKGLVSGASR